LVSPSRFGYFRNFALTESSPSVDTPPSVNGGTKGQATSGAKEEVRSRSQHQ
jgi:hypothetical protein